jgi:hypothetical protein
VRCAVKLILEKSFGYPSVDARFHKINLREGAQEANRCVLARPGSDEIPADVHLTARGGFRDHAGDGGLAWRMMVGTRGASEEA